MKRLLLLETNHGIPEVAGIYKDREELIYCLQKGNLLGGYYLEDWDNLGIFDALEKKGHYNGEGTVLSLEEITIK